MNRIYALVLAGAVTLPLFVTSCDTFENPNAASADQVLGTVEGLQSLAIGMRRTYSIETLSSVVRTSGLTAREFGVLVGFTNPQEIEVGGTALPSENGILTGLWSNNYQVMAMAEDIIANVDVIKEDATRNAFLAFGHFMKGVTLGNLAMFYESYPVGVDPDGAGTFESRTAGLQEAVSQLEAGLSALGSGDVPADFQSKVLGTSDFNLRQSLNAYLARFNGFLGNHSAAISAADAALADPGAKSMWTFEVGSGNDNPLWTQTTEVPATLYPVDNFGFDPSEFVVSEEDGRVAFYLAPVDTIGESSRIPLDEMRGFFDVRDESIPVYLPGEMHLIKAEAYARQGQIGNAVSSIDAVRTKSDDPFGVNAAMGPYTGEQSEGAVLLEIYRNRRIELFLTGLSLEDSRRFNRPDPPIPASYESYNRNRNFYPYPQRERDSNPNTPADPTI